MGEDLKQEERETNWEQHDIDIFQNQIQGIGPFFYFYPTHTTSNSNYPLWVFYLHNSLLIEKTTHSTDQFTDHTLLLNQSIFNDRDLNLQHEMDTNRDQILDLNTIWLDPTGWDGLHNQFT